MKVVFDTNVIIDAVASRQPFCKEAEEILNKMGMSISDYINLALYQVRITRRIPFELVAEPPFPYEWLPNFEKDIEEAHAAVANGAKTYKTAAELRAALEAEDINE